MGAEEELYAELCELRARIRHDNTKRGREPVVCSDDALRQMARHPPVKEADLLAVDGFGETSVDRYGAQFLRVTHRYAMAAAGGQGIDAETARALRELQKRLVNLSRSNRLLSMIRTGTGVSFDAGALFGEDVRALVTSGKGTLTVDRKAQPAAFRRLNSIVREVNRDLRERGTYDLYIGYPFVEGTLPGEDGFPVRAPLALFPVIMDKRGDIMTVEFDSDRDAVFNTTLVLAAMKASGTKGDLADAVIDDSEDLGTQLTRFYSASGFEFTTPEGVEPFAEYKAAEVPVHAPGSFTVTPNLVLGKFPTYSSLVERDIDLLINGKEVNENLRGLLKGLYSGDFRSEYPLPLSAADLAAKGIVPVESELFCINRLDAAQEAALAAVEKEDGLVVQGPPGTGKSQVITAMIASAAYSGRTVLMVSEKKTALDVVRSRLGDLSRFCMQIDDTADKEGFFRQLRGIISIQPVGPEPDMVSVSERISERMERLGDLSDSVFGTGRFGISPVELRDLCNGMDADSPLFRNYGTVAASLMSLSSQDIDRMINRFSEGRLLRNLKSYSNTVSKLPWTEFIRPDLTEKDLGEMATELGLIYQEGVSAPKKGIISRLFSRGGPSKRASALAARFLTDYSRSDVEDMVSDPEAAVEFLEEYDMFEAHAEAYRSLSSEERSWWRGMGTASRKGGLDISASGTALRDVIYMEHSKEFEARMPALLEESLSRESYVSEINGLMEEKRGLARSAAASVLYSHLSEITSSKRFADISRISEQKRKWSVAKFMSRYGYELFKGIRIWLMTPEAVSETVPLEMGTFDLLVFDEASQMFTERGVPSIYRARKTVVAGDHKQLRPSSLGRGRLSYDDDEDSPEEGSLLDLARSRYDSVLLNYHYRSERSALIAFSDRAFYGGRLFVSPDTTASVTPPIEVIRTDGVWEDRTNPVEADRVVALLKDVLNNRERDETVGIIAFNIHQMDLIADRIEEACAEDPAFAAVIEREENRKDNGEDVGLFIKNVESVQGDERDVIIFSIGYAKGPDGRFVQRFGWLNMAGGENRLNVAVTRARKKIYIVQSFDAEDLETDNATCEGPRILKRYLEYARAVSEGDSDKANAVLDTMSTSTGSVAHASDGFMDRLFEAVKAAGYEAVRDVGMGRCSIDIAVMVDGRCTVGIENDREIYATGGTVRERDYHREVFLESRGWKTVRVWTPAAQRDPEGEIARILNEITKIVH